MSEHHQSHAYSGAKALLYRLASGHSDIGELATLHYSAKEPAHSLITVLTSSGCGTLSHTIILYDRWGSLTLTEHCTVHTYRVIWHVLLQANYRSSCRFYKVSYIHC